MNKFVVTLSGLRKAGACVEGYNRVVRAIQGREFTDEDFSRVGYIRLSHKNPISIRFILDSNGLEDVLWSLRCIDNADKDKDIRLFAVWCARQVEHLMGDPRITNALAVAERHAYGAATDDELCAARAAAWSAADAAARAAADAAADAAAWSVADAAARAAADAAAWSAARAEADAAAWSAARAEADAAAWSAARAAADAAAWSAARAAADAAAWSAADAAARAAAKAAQKNRLIEMLDAGAFQGDTKSRDGDKP